MEDWQPSSSLEQEDDEDEEEEVLPSKKKTTKIPKGLFAAGLFGEKDKDEDEKEDHKDPPRFLRGLLKTPDEDEGAHAEAEETATPVETFIPALEEEPKTVDDSESDDPVVQEAGQVEDQGDSGEINELDLENEPEGEILLTSRVISPTSETVIITPEEPSEKSPEEEVESFEIETDDDLEAEDSEDELEADTEIEDSTAEEDIEDEEEEPDEATTTTASSPPPPTPPVVPPAGVGMPPPPPTPMGTTGGAPFTPVQPQVQNIEAQLNDAEYEGRRDGQRRGIVTGLLVGWMVGRRGKGKMKEAIKENEKDLKSQAEEIQRLHDEQEKQKQRIIELSKNPDQPVQAESVPEKPTEVLERVLVTAAVVNESAPLAETARAHVRYEVDSRGKVKIERSPDKAIPDPEKIGVQSNDQPISQEAYPSPEDVRVETSSWYRIEVDAKTGKTIENPNIEYGDEFKHELRQERLLQDEQKHLGSMPVGFAVDDNTQIGTPTYPQDNSQIPPAKKLRANAVQKLVQDIVSAQPSKEFAVFLGVSIIIFAALLVLFTITIF